MKPSCNCCCKVDVCVPAPPVLGEVSPSFLIQKEGDTVDLFCEASATPEPTLSWFKDNRELQSSENVVVHGNRLQLRGVTRTDGGVYSCIFKNTVGRVSHIIKLIIEGKWQLLLVSRVRQTRRLFSCDVGYMCSWKGGDLACEAVEGRRLSAVRAQTEITSRGVYQGSITYGEH